jgi:homoserine kinase type II
MGIKTKISLEELNDIFKGYNFTKLIPTSSGVVDTTYIAHTNNTAYIVKRYERDIEKKVDADKKLLEYLGAKNLEVSQHIKEQKKWHLYKKLNGTQPTHIRSFHISSLARFMASMHLLTYKQTNGYIFLDAYNTKKYLKYLKSNFFLYYKKLSFLKHYKQRCDGIIHGDIFKDNTLFDGLKIAVFDFIDAGCGSFVFDIAVALVGFGVSEKKSFYIELFLNTYNQKSVKKISKDELLKEMKNASAFYALLRIQNHKNTKKAKELIKT